MNKPVAAVVAITLIAAGGYTAVWFKKSADLKESFSHSVAMLNEKTKAMYKTGEMLAYESAEVSGFPFSVQMTVKKPVLRVAIPELLRLIPKDRLNGEVPPEFDWVEEFSLDDSVTLTSNIIGSDFTLEVKGAVTEKAMQDGKERTSIISKGAAPLLCHLQTKSLGFLALYPRPKDADEFFESFKSANCALGGREAIDAATGKVISTIKKVDFAFANALGNAHTRTASFKISSLDSNYTKDWDPIWNVYTELYFGALGKKVEPLAYSLSEFGNMSFTVDVAYDGPDSINALSEPNARMRFDINGFDMKSSLFNTETAAHIMLEPENQNRKASVSISSKTNVSERYDEVLAQQTEKTIADLVNPEGKSGPELEIATSLAKLGEPKQVTQMLLPKFHPLGDMVFVLDAKLEGPNEGPNFLLKGTSTLTALNILTAPYGVKSEGNYNGKDGPPSGNLTVTCLNCDELVTDLGAYINRVKSYMMAASPEKKTTLLPPEFFAGLKKFIRGISVNGADANAKDLTMALVVKNTGDATISGKQIMEVMQSYMVDVTSHLPKEEPPQLSPQNIPSIMKPQTP